VSTSILIVIQLAFLLVISWLFAVVAIRKLRSSNDQQAELIRQLKRNSKRQVSKRANTYSESEVSDVDLFDESTPASVDDIASALNDLGSEYDHHCDDLSELDAMLKAQSDSILRMRQMREAIDDKKKTVDTGALKRELSSLKERNKRSETIITELNNRLEGSQSRMKAVQRQMTRLKADSGMAGSLERENRRLSMDRSKLEQKLKKEMFKHQQVIERIQAQLSVAEKRSSQGIHKAKMREQKLLSTINELQDRLRVSDGSDVDESEVRMLKDELNRSQDALNRAVNEKEFLESNFVDLEKALQESASAKDELERTKKEYQMLEDHFLALDEEREQQMGQNNGDIDVPEHRKNLETLNPVEVSTATESDVFSESS
jgi:chromosome segregation ATPase